MSRMTPAAIGRTAVSLLLFASGLLLLAGTAPAPPYSDAAQPVDARVKDLLGRMTHEEKIAQVTAYWKKDTFSDAEGRCAPDKAKLVLAHGVGQISRPSEVTPTSPQGPLLRVALRAWATRSAAYTQCALT